MVNVWLPIVNEAPTPNSKSPVEASAVNTGCCVTPALPFSGTYTYNVELGTQVVQFDGLLQLLLAAPVHCVNVTPAKVTLIV